MKHGTLECDHCGAPVTYKTPFCPYCRAKLLWDAHIVLQRGERFAGVDLARDPLPDADKRFSAPVQRPDGVLLESGPTRMQRGHFAALTANACAVLRGVCLDPHGTFGVVARMHKHGRSSAGYEVEIYPAYRSFRLRRALWIDSELEHVIVHDYEYSPFVAGVQHPNELELRAADSLFQIVINGQIAASLVDASFGFGQFGWTVGSESNVASAHVLLRSMELYRVR